MQKQFCAALSERNRHPLSIRLSSLANIRGRKEFGPSSDRPRTSSRERASCSQPRALPLQLLARCVRRASALRQNATCLRHRERSFSPALSKHGSEPPENLTVLNGQV